MPSSPLVADIETLALEIRTNGQPIDDTYVVLAVDVDREVNRIPTARVVISEGDVGEIPFPASNSADFVPGTTIDILAGYGSTMTKIFAGVIVGHGIRLTPDGASTIILTCADKATKLTLTRSSRQFLKMKDSDIISQLVSSAGLTADVGATTVEHAQLLQHFSSAWDFIVGRADANGQLVVVDDGTVRVRAPAFASPSLVVRVGESLGELEADIDARTQLPTITSRAWDAATQEVVTSTSSEPTVNTQGNLSGEALLKTFSLNASELQTMAGIPQPTLTAWANGRLLRSRLARIRGHVSFPGSASPKPGQTIELDGLGERFNGDAFVNSVEHRFSTGHWLTRVGFGLSPTPYTAATPDIESPAAAGLVPAARGLQIATVLQTHEDPDGQRRVKVLMPLVTKGGEGVWVRMLAPYASSKAGMFFMPEVNDEVVLGFLGDDPSAAILLGSLHSSSRAAPYVPEQKNATKAIVSNSQLKISFDDEKKVLVIETPGGNVVTLSDDAKSITIVDSHANKVEMGSAGITLSSASDVAISAKGSVSIEGKGGVSIKSPMDVKVDGLNVQLNAQVALAAKGQAQAELSASGQVTVRGAIVMIN
jgi:Rhs element Vgr protein